MQNKIIAWVWDMPVRGNTKLVLFMLADHAGEDGTCCPGVNRLAQIGGISRSSVIRQIKKLIELGIISKEMRPNNSNLYQLNIHLKPEAVGGVS